MPNALNVISFNHVEPYEVGATIFPNLQMTKLSLWEVK